MQVTFSPKHVDSRRINSYESFIHHSFIYLKAYLIHLIHVYEKKVCFKTIRNKNPIENASNKKYKLNKKRLEIDIETMSHSE